MKTDKLANIRRGRFTGLITTLLFCALGLMACSGGPSTDSETHWMQSCEADADCDADLSCICNVCTLECDGDCSALGELATCGQAPQWCGDASGQLCLIECENSDECENGASCEGGLCVDPGGFDIGEPECQEDVPFYCEGDDCCPGDCYALSDSLIDVDEGCRLDQGEAYYCISPQVLSEDKPGTGDDLEDCYMDSSRDLAFLLPTQTPEVPTGGESPLQPCSSEVEVIFGQVTPDCALGFDPYGFKPDDEHRECTDHDECVWIYADCTQSCYCESVHEDYKQIYDDMLDDCPGIGDCDYECRGENFQEVSRCEDGLCTRFRSGSEESWIDRIDLDDDYTIAVAAYLDETGGLDEEQTSFLLESLVDDSRLYYDDIAEREEFTELPEAHLYANSRDIFFDNELEGRLFYSEDEAVAVVGTDGQYREVVFAQGEILGASGATVGWADSGYLTAMLATIEEK